MSLTKPIKIGTRGSELALWQANFVREELEKRGHEVEITIIKTQGDKIQHLSFDKMEGKGFFTKEIEASLLNEDVDLAVHSHKDLETNREHYNDRLLSEGMQFLSNPGDVLMYDSRTLHSTMPNGSSEFRSALLINALKTDIIPRVQELDGNTDFIKK